MRIFTFLLFLFFLSPAMYSQSVLVNSPEGVAGFYQFTAAAFGADLSSDVWTGDAILADDGSALPNEGCGALVNATDVAGKIVLVDRGSCEFGLKCMNAQNAGAIGVIVFNNAPGTGTIIMGAGAVGDMVTIPAVMLSYEDGVTLKAALAQGPVNISIGNIAIPNDIGTDRNLMFYPRYNVVPSFEINAPGDFAFNPGLIAVNKGANDATNVVASASISHTPPGGSTVIVYDESTSVGNLNSGDTSGIITYPSFDFHGTGAGAYQLQYELDMDAEDDAPGDNSFISNIVVSNNVYSKASWDLANNRPFATIGYTISGGGPIEFLTGFEIQNGTGKQIDSMYFYVSVGGGLTLSNINLTAFIYMWVDANEDGEVSADELQIVALAIIDEFPDPSATTAHMKVEILDFNTFEPGWELPLDNTNVFAGIRFMDEGQVFFGFDQNVDYSLNETELGLSDMDFPYFGANNWDGSNPSSFFIFTNVRNAPSLAIVVNDVPTSTDNSAELPVHNIAVYPNPANEYINVTLDLVDRAEQVTYNIYNAAGQLMFTTSSYQVLSEQINLNVAALPSGLYFLNVRSEHGGTTRSFTIQR